MFRFPGPSQSVPRPPKSKPPPLQSCFGVEGLRWVSVVTQYELKGWIGTVPLGVCPLRAMAMTLGTQLFPLVHCRHSARYIFNGWTVPISAPHVVLAAPVAPVADHQWSFASFFGAGSLGSSQLER